MKVKFYLGVTLTKEQMIEIANVVLKTPDMFWTDEKNAYLNGEYGVYIYSVDTKKNIITIKKIGE